MKIEHMAIWVKDIDKVCEFYRKYFGGEVHPLYHNPAKQFTSRFITFKDGARLEIMHRPDINVGTLTESKENIDSKTYVGTISSIQSYLNRLGNRTKYIWFCFTRLIRFHVKRPIASVATGSSLTGMTEHEDVGLWRSHSPNTGFAHLAFSVGSKEKVDHLTQQMSDDGITIVGQPRTTGDGYYESVVLDPEGNRIEITV